MRAEEARKLTEQKREENAKNQFDIQSKINEEILDKVKTAVSKDYKKLMEKDIPQAINYGVFYTKFKIKTNAFFIPTCDEEKYKTMIIEKLNGLGYEVEYEEDSKYDRDSETYYTEGYFKVSW